MSIETFLSGYDDNVRAIALRLCELVREVMPSAHENVTGHKNIAYSTDAGVMKGGMIYVAPFNDSVNLGFIDGVDLPDPQGLLKGTGKRLRHIKFKDLTTLETQQDAIRALLESAKSLKD